MFGRASFAAIPVIVLLLFWISEDLSVSDVVDSENRIDDEFFSVLVSFPIREVTKETSGSFGFAKKAFDEVMCDEMRNVVSKHVERKWMLCFIQFM